jgi:hypothetical protein
MPMTRQERELLRKLLATQRKVELLTASLHPRTLQLGLVTQRAASHQSNEQPPRRRSPRPSPLSPARRRRR